MKRLIRGFRRRIRLILKRVYKQRVQQPQKAREMKSGFRVYNGRRSLTIREMCGFLRIKVPREYSSHADTFVDLTPALKRHRDGQSPKIVWSDDSIYSLDNEWFATSNKKQALGFKRRYFLYNFEKHSDKELLEMYADYRCNFAHRGFEYHAYFDYRFFEKSPEDTVDYLSFREIAKFRNYRVKKYIKYFQDKGLFLKRFNDFVRRDWIDTRKCSLQEFKDFAKRNQRFMVKPAKSSSGKGVEIVSPSGDVENFYRKCVDNKMIAEELIRQHKDLAAVNKDTVNTVRINTLAKPSGDVVLMTPLVRFGREGKVVDNGAAGGVWALIDPDTGVVISDGIDRNGNSYSVHPDSKSPLKGFQVPCWDKIVETCLTAAKTIPQIPYIGWDVAVSENDEVMFVEGNSATAFFLVQMQMPPGALKAMWKPILSEFEAVISIEKLCELLRIDVPKEYESVKSKPANNTELFTNLKAKDKSGDFSSAVDSGSLPVGYNGLEKCAKAFKWSYRRMSTLNNSDEELLQLFVEYLYAFRPLRFSVYQYFAFQLHKKSIEEAKEYIDVGFRGRISKCNLVGYRKYFRQKILFYNKFDKYIRRRWVYAPDSNLHEFTEFVKEFSTCLAKPIDGLMGRGVKIIEVPDEAEIEYLYQQCIKEKLILEQLVSNEKTIKAISPYTLNTLRINTFVDVNGEPNVLAAAIRLGRGGNAVDNYAAGGLLASIDVGSGVIITDAVDKSHAKYTVHPDSLKEIKGVKIPQWDEIIETVKELAMVVPEVRNVGWDIALAEDGTVEPIEGNDDCDLDIMQEPDQVGKRHLYEKYVEEVEELRENESLSTLLYHAKELKG